MPDNAKRLHSILIVSFSDQFAASVKKSLKSRQFMNADICKNVAAARRAFFERYYDIVVINFPLPDETGAEFAYDIAEKGNASVLIAAPSEIYAEVLDQITDYGILAISKPVQGNQLGQAIRLLAAIQDKMQQLQQEITTLHERMEELRVVGKAKSVLIAKKHMTEDEAHRFIGKEAMNHGVSRKRIAEQILEEYDD